MIALQVENIRDFMHKLLLEPVFDAFRVSEASITTFTTFTIDGQLHPEFYDGELSEPSPEPQASWADIRPFCTFVFKGKRLPLSFHIVLQLSREQLPQFLLDHDLTIAPEDVFGLFLNMQYRNGTLTLTTGSSLRIFSGNRSLDAAWDQYVRAYLDREGLT